MNTRLSLNSTTGYFLKITSSGQIKGPGIVEESHLHCVYASLQGVDYTPNQIGCGFCKICIFLVVIFVLWQPFKHFDFCKSIKIFSFSRLVRWKCNTLTLAGAAYGNSKLESLVCRQYKMQLKGEKQPRESHTALIEGRTWCRRQAGASPPAVFTTCTYHVGTVDAAERAAWEKG